MTERLSPAAFIAQAQERIRNTFIDLVGIRLLEVSNERAVAEMPFTESLQQLTGMFHAGALISLADTTATYACLYWTNGTLGGLGKSFPFTIQLSTNFIHNTGEGTIRAEAAPVHRGRTTIVVETRITDANGRLLIVVTTTHLVVRG
jgi:1,4-dihydroxy-2-naphthoyl-CoA hydrolase